MTDTLRELLRQGADAVDLPTLDPADAVAAGDQRLRRRRVTVVVAAVTAVVLITAGSLLLGGSRDRSQGPVDQPTDTSTTAIDQGTPPPPRRPIVWTNDFTELKPGNDVPDTRVGVLHVGNREVEIGQVLHSVQSWSMFVTDAGAVYGQDDGSVWLTDGGRPLRIASQTCAIAAGSRQFLGLATGNVGALVAWFDCSDDSRGDLVVYDALLRREVVRHPLPRCARPYSPPVAPAATVGCAPWAILGQHVYYATFDRDDERAGEFVLDVASGRVRQVGERDYLADVRSQTRALQVGDSYRTGTPTEATGSLGLYFQPVGRRLVPVANDPYDDGSHPTTRAFRATTADPVRFRLPAGYRPPRTDVPTRFVIFEWLDDDTVALVDVGGAGEVITCRLPDGDCRPVLHDIGVVANWYLPG